MARIGKRKCRTYTIGKGKVWDGIKNFFKKTKILSSAATLIPGVGNALSNVVKNVGYSCRRRHRRKGGMANPFAKKTLGGLPCPKEYSVETKKTGPKINKGGPSSIPKFLKKGSGKRIKKRHNGDNYENKYIDNKIRVL